MIWFREIILQSKRISELFSTIRNCLLNSGLHFNQGCFHLLYKRAAGKNPYRQRQSKCILYTTRLVQGPGLALQSNSYGYRLLSHLPKIAAWHDKLSAYNWKENISSSLSCILYLTSFLLLTCTSGMENFVWGRLRLL